MNITGTVKKEIYPQTLCNWSAIVSLQHTSGNLDYYLLSNNSEKIFSLESGSIKCADGDLIGGYFAGEDLNLSGNINSQSFDLYHNNIAILLGKNRKTTGVVSGMLFETNSKNQDINLKSLIVNGDIPVVKGPTEEFLIMFSDLPVLEYKIRNYGDYAFKIYSGYTTNINYVISGANNVIVPSGGSGSIYIAATDGIINASIQDVDVNILTTYGEQTFNTKISGQERDSSSWMLNLTPQSNLIVDNGLDQFFTANVVNTDGANIGVGIKYVSGITGDYYDNIFGSGYAKNTSVSGYVTGSGYLFSDTSTGIISGYNPYTDTYVYGTGIGRTSGFYIANSGLLKGKYTTIATGAGCSDICGGPIDATGYYILTGEFEGISTSGALNYNFPVTGYYTGDYIKNYPYYFPVTGTRDAERIIPINTDQLNITHYIKIYSDPSFTFYYDPIINDNYVTGFNQYFYNLNKLVSGINIFCSTGNIPVRAQNLNDEIFSGKYSQITGIRVYSMLNADAGNNTMLTTNSTLGINMPQTGYLTGGANLFSDKKSRLYYSSGFYGTVSGTLYQTGYYESNNGSGSITGDILSLLFKRSLSNIWTIKTGVADSYYTYDSGNIVSESEIFGTANDNDLGIYNTIFNIGIKYTDVSNGSNAFSISDVADLYVTGYNFPSNTGTIFRITGIKLI